MHMKWYMCMDHENSMVIKTRPFCLMWWYSQFIAVETMNLMPCWEGVNIIVPYAPKQNLILMTFKLHFIIISDQYSLTLVQSIYSFASDQNTCGSFGASGSFIRKSNLRLLENKTIGEFEWIQLFSWPWVHMTSTSDVSIWSW